MSYFERRSSVGALLATAVGSVCLAIPATTASAQSIEQDMVNGVIQNVLQNVRDQIQRRNVRIPGRQGPGPMRFTNDEGTFDPSNPFADNSSSNPINALAYGKVYTKAPPAVLASPSYIYGINLVGSADESRSDAAGFTTVTRAYGVTGSFDVTKIGILTEYDALTFVGTGSGIWSSQPGAESDTSLGAGTIMYSNGGFSTDHTIGASWTALRAIGLVAPANSTGLSYSGNVQYKFDYTGGWFIEPQVGVTYAQVYGPNFAGAKISDTTELHGGVRVGTEWAWNNVRIQPTLSGAAFTIVDESPIFVNKGRAGARGSGKLNIIWSEAFSTYVEAHGSGIANTTSFGGSGGVRWSF